MSPDSFARAGTPSYINSLAPERFQRNFRKVIFQIILVIDGWSIACKIVLKWMPMDLTDGKSTLDQVMAWCHQATSQYLSQCWSRSLSQYSVIRPQWVKVCAILLKILVPIMATRVTCLIINWLAPGRCCCILNVWYSNRFEWSISCPFSVKLFSSECHRSSLMINDHWFR